jgi:hypothetical protein
MAKPRLDDPLTPEQLRAVLLYEPETGIFTWRSRPDRSVQANGRWAGKQAGTPGRNGLSILISRRHYKAHRLAWFYVHGVWPEAEIDHINGDWRDNRIANLRNATRNQNSANGGMSKFNKVGLKGVSWSQKARLWRAQIDCDKVHYHFGYFTTPEDAYAAYCEAAVRLHGEFARLK